MAFQDLVVPVLGVEEDAHLFLKRQVHLTLMPDLPDGIACHTIVLCRVTIRYHLLPPSAAAGQATIIVPTPLSVKISVSRACGVRPSRMWARGTPPSRPIRQA